LAYHFSAAGERDKAIRYSRSAARRAESVYAYEAGVQHLNDALNWLKGSQDSETHSAVLEQLADIYWVQNLFPQAIPLYRQAMTLRPIVSSEDKIIAVRLRRKFGHSVLHLYSFADFERFAAEARRQLEAAWQMAEPEPPHAEIVYLLTTLALAMWVRQLAPGWDAAERYARSAIDMAERLEEPVLLSIALDALAQICGARGLLRERLDLARRRLELSQDTRFGDQRQRIRILLQVGTAFTFVGEYVQALRYLLEAQTLTEQMHAVELRVQVLAGQLLCWLRLDRWDELLQSEPMLRSLQRRYAQEEIRYPCWHIAIYASVYALRGASEQAARLRTESFQLMTARTAPTGWSRTQHY
jgi:tetratricopeptide (TPR) repeat protein